MRYAKLSVVELLAGTINGFPFPGGVGMGKPHYLVPADSATSKFRGWLVKNGVNPSDIFTSLVSAEDVMVANRNDTLFVFPGDYAETAKTTWDKDDTHIFGLNDNVEGDYTQGGCNIYTTTASVAQVLDIQGDRCAFKNLKLSNGGANAANLGAALVEGYGCRFRNVNFMGILDAAQIASANPYSLGIGWGGYFPTFEDCIIGTSTWGPQYDNCIWSSEIHGCRSGILSSRRWSFPEMPVLKLGRNGYSRRSLYRPRRKPEVGSYVVV